MRTMTTMLTAALALAVPALSGCGSKTDTLENADIGNFTPPAVRAPTPVAGQAQTTPLTAYVGKYPHDAVGGVDFFDRTDVANALIDAVGDQKLRSLIRGRSGPETPIFLAGQRVGAWGCEAHNCGDHNWTLLVDPKGKAEACHHDAATMGQRSAWYAGAAPVTRPGGCPSGEGEDEGGADAGSNAGTDTGTDAGAG